MRFRPRFAQDGAAATSHGDRVWAEYGRKRTWPTRLGAEGVARRPYKECLCIFVQFTEGDFRTRPRLVRRTLDYVVDLREKMEGRGGGHVSSKFGEYEFSTGHGFLYIVDRRLDG